MTGQNNAGLAAAVCSERGRPPKNEDNFVLNGGFKPLELADRPVLARCPPARQGLFAVCDGMGGAAFGEVASLMAVQLLSAEAPRLLQAPGEEGRVLDLIRRAHASIRKESRARKAPMGSTAVIALVREGWADLYNVGDSRAYLWTGALAQISRDHTLEQTLREMGMDGSRAAMRHKLTQYLGMEEEEYTLDPYRCRVQLPPGARLLLCSDGLTDMVPDSDLAACLAAPGGAAAAAEALVGAALERGGKDNVTALVIDA